MGLSDKEKDNIARFGEKVGGYATGASVVGMAVGTSIADTVAANITGGVIGAGIGAGLAVGHQIYKAHQGRKKHLQDGIDNARQ